MFVEDLVLIVTINEPTGSLIKDTFQQTVPSSSLMSQIPAKLD